LRQTCETNKKNAVKWSTDPHSRPILQGIPIMQKSTGAPSPEWLRSRPIAHRGLHNKAAGIWENTLSAVRAAASRGFHIEVDLHPSSDGVPIVFHDLDLKRLTGETGRIRDRSAAAIAQLRVGGSNDAPPTLRQLLDAVAARVGLVLEMKGVAGEDDGFLAAIARDLAGYGGPVAIMSFNHWLLADARRVAPDLPLGLTAEGNNSLHDVHAGADRQFGVEFLSYSLADLPCRFASEFRRSGRPVISWTARSPADAARSALHADQITFEGFDP
jgi:glycerophosphoryl diester phosphodiesterase